MQVAKLAAICQLGESSSARAPASQRAGLTSGPISASGAGAELRPAPAQAVPLGQWDFPESAGPSRSRSPLAARRVHIKWRRRRELAGAPPTGSLGRALISEEGASAPAAPVQYVSSSPANNKSRRADLLFAAGPPRPAASYLARALTQPGRRLTDERRQFVGRSLRPEAAGRNCASGSRD